RKQRLPAADAVVGAGVLGVPVFAAESPLRSLLAGDAVLFGREELPPFLVGLRVRHAHGGRSGGGEHTEPEKHGGADAEQCQSACDSTHPGQGHAACLSATRLSVTPTLYAVVFARARSAGVLRRGALK